MVAILVGVWPKAAFAYEIPTSPMDTWLGTGISTGSDALSGVHVEAGTYQKTTPSGLTVTISVDGDISSGTTTGSSGSYFGALGGTNTTFMNPSVAGTSPGDFSTSPTMPSTSNPILLETLFNSCAASFPTETSCDGLGTINITFTDPVGGAVPVVGPRIHITKLGGKIGAAEFATGLQIDLTASTSGTGLSAIAGAATATLAVNGDNEVFGNPFAVGSTLDDNCDAASTSSAGCGSIQVTGAPSIIQFNVKGYRSSASSSDWAGSSDLYAFDMSFDEDFGGAPNSYEAGGTAAAHIISDLRFGSTVSADNIGTANGAPTGTNLITTNPQAVSAALPAGDTNDGASFPPLLIQNWNLPYTVVPTISGASRSGKICGWIDFDRSGTFSQAEGICNSFAADATSAPLVWIVPSEISSGPTYARLRVTYDTNIDTSSFNGLFSSGEVEDYLIHIKPTLKLVKYVVPPNDPGRFNLSIGGIPFANNVGDTGNTLYRSAYHTDSPEIPLTIDVSNAPVTGVVMSETAFGSTLLSNYYTTSTCNNKNIQLPPSAIGGTPSAPSVTIPKSITGSGANGLDQFITCQIFNKRKPTLTLSAVSMGSGGGSNFTFTGTNGWTSQTITTVSSGVAVTGTPKNLNVPTTATTITETVPPGFALTAIACSGLGDGGTATPHLTTASVVLDAAATSAGSNIACTFTNTRAVLRIQKSTLNAFGGPFAFA